MSKLAVRSEKRSTRESERDHVRRPQRPEGLGGFVVETVLHGKRAVPARINDYLVLLHLAAGLALLAFCMEDISAGGPARPMIVPILGGYMAASVVFYAVLKDRDPVLLLWINGLSDIVFLIAAQRLAYISFANLGPDLTVALLMTVAAIVYGATGHARLMIVLSAILTTFFCYTLVSPATGYPALDRASVSALLLVVLAAAAGYRLARLVQRRELSAAILTLERIDATVTTQRLRRRRIDGSFRT